MVKSLSLSGRDEYCLPTLMSWHLSRLRQITPWPLSHEETLRLWWSDESWDVLKELEAAGQHPDNGVNVVVLAVEDHIHKVYLQCDRNTLLIPKHASYGSFNVTVRPDSDGYFALRSWLDEASERGKEIDLVERAWHKLLREATSWLQLYKAFPEAFEILVGAAPRYLAAMPDSFSERDLRGYVIPKLLDAWAQVRGSDHLNSRAHSMPLEVREQVNAARPIATRLCAQAAMMPAESAGRLDDSIFAETWVRLTR